MLKLHIGCGQIYLDGWTNIDLDSEKADIKHDIRNPLPFEDNSVDIIYSEHFIEHLDPEEGVAFMRECRRVMNAGAVMRIAAPDLHYVVIRYLFNWRKQEWIERFGYSHIKTRAEMTNMMFHFWGHKWLYDYEELNRRLQEAGFDKINKVKYHKSNTEALRNLETRKDSKLIVEAVK